MTTSVRRETALVAVLCVAAAAGAWAQTTPPKPLPATFAAIQVGRVNNEPGVEGYVTSETWVDGVNKRLLALNQQQNSPGVNASFEWILIDVGNKRIIGAGGAEVGVESCCTSPLPSGPEWAWPETFWKPGTAYSGSKPACMVSTNLTCNTGTGTLPGNGSGKMTMCFYNSNPWPVCSFPDTAPTMDSINNYISMQPFPPTAITNSRFAVDDTCSTPCAGVQSEAVHAAAKRVRL